MRIATSTSTDTAIGSPATPRWPAGLARGVMLAAVAVALATGFVLTDRAEAAHAVSTDGADLARLLRAMAVLKLTMAAAATAAVLWRLGSPAAPLWLAAYAAAALAMWTGPGLIWDMAHLKLGALLLHGGLAGSLVLLWRDRVIGDRLAAIIAARRQALRNG